MKKRDYRNYDQKVDDAWRAWKQGKPTPKIIQKMMKVGPNTLYAHYIQAFERKRKKEENV